MKTKIQVNPRLLFFLKCLLFSSILTGVLLFLLALALYRLHLSEGVVRICITVIYVLATFFAGFITGKREGNKKFLWGLLAGSLYFLVILIISFLMKSADGLSSSHALTVLILCAGGGMLGGMLS